jgi:hypothetical protein
MLLITLSVSVVMVQSLTTVIVKDESIFLFWPVPESICGMVDVVVTT